MFKFSYQRTNPLPEVSWSEPLADPQPIEPTEREREMLATIQQQNDVLESMQQEIIRLSGIESAARETFDVLSAAASDGLPIFKLRKREDPEMASQIGHAFVNLTYALGAHVPPPVLGSERILH